MNSFNKFGIVKPNIRSVNIPELPLEPPEDTRRVYAYCKVCEEPIMEHDECREYPKVGCICEDCTSKYYKGEVVLD